MAETPKPSISDDAVQKRTGKTWDEWFAILDAAGAVQMKHPEIATYLSKEHGVPDWWAQSVTVEFERARGLRAMHQKSDGFVASVSRTLPVPVSALYEAWQDEARSRWLPETITVRRATPNKSMRVTWSDGRGNVDVQFYAKGSDKSQVAVQHSKLESPEEVEEKRELWRSAMTRLAETLTADAGGR